MPHTTMFRMGLILMYFMLLGACGGPKDSAPPESQDDGGVAAGDINFIGGGTQAPEENLQEHDYQSPFIDKKNTPTSLKWVSSINQAKDLAGKDRKYRIIVWFESLDCVECTAIKRDIFHDPDVLKESGGWLFVQLDTDVDKKDAEYMLGGADPPALVFLDRTGNEYKRHIGSFTREEFLTMLREYR